MFQLHLRFGYSREGMGSWRETSRGQNEGPVVHTMALSTSCSAIIRLLFILSVIAIFASSASAFLPSKGNGRRRLLCNSKRSGRQGKKKGLLTSADSGLILNLTHLVSYKAGPFRPQFIAFVHTFFNDSFCTLMLSPLTTRR